MYICNTYVYCLPPLLQLSHITIIPLCSNIAHKELPPYTKMCYEAEISVLKQGHDYDLMFDSKSPNLAPGQNSGLKSTPQSPLYCNNRMYSKYLEEINLPIYLYLLV